MSETKPQNGAKRLYLYLGIGVDGPRFMPRHSGLPPSPIPTYDDTVAS